VRKLVKWWLPVIIWMIVIFIGSSIGSVPRVGGKALDAVVHRVAHVIEFAVLGALTLRAMSQGKRVTKRGLISTVIVVVLYGASDELHQRFTPGRSSEGIAVVFDAVGGLMGAWLYRAWLSADLKGRSSKQRINESAKRRVDEP
jgi:VanZ family protein